MRYVDLNLFEASQSNVDLLRRYNYYNKLLFNGELPQIPITYAKMKHAGGKVSYVVTLRNPPPNPVLVRLGKISKFYGATLKPNSLHMKISDTFIRSDEGLNAIIIHEMIHVYFTAKGQFNVGHGYPFISMAKKLGDIVGFKIPLRDEIDTDNMTLSDHRNFKPVFVVIRNTGSVSNFAIFNIPFIEKNMSEISRILEKTINMNYAIGILAGITTEEYWNKIATILPLQRTYGRTTKWYIIPTDQREIATSALKKGKIYFKMGDI